MPRRGGVEEVRWRSGQQPCVVAREALWSAILDFVFHWEGFSDCNGNNKLTLFEHSLCQALSKELIPHTHMHFLL